MCPHTIDLRGVIDLPDINQKEVDPAALDPQKAHSHTKEELMKMKVKGLQSIAEGLYLNTEGKKEDLISRIMTCSTSPEEADQLQG